MYTYIQRYRHSRNLINLNNSLVKSQVGEGGGGASLHLKRALNAFSY